MAGLAGGLYAGLRQTVGASDFDSFNSFLLLLLVVVAGVTSVTGAAFGGIGLMLLKNNPEAQPVMFVLIAVMAILLARNPNGLAIYLFRFGRWLQSKLAPRLLASLPQLDRDDGDDGDDGDEGDETASRIGDDLVEPDETVVTPTTGAADAREVPAHVAR
jgi:branched-chain amino acid transport system permease protein